MHRSRFKTAKLGPKVHKFIILANNEVQNRPVSYGGLQETPDGLRGRGGLRVLNQKISLEGEGKKVRKNQGSHLHKSHASASPCKLLALDMNVVSHHNHPQNL